MIALALKAATFLRPVLAWLEHRAGGKEEVDAAIAEGSRKLGLGKSVIVVLVLAPLAAPWLSEVFGLAGASTAASQVVAYLSGEEGGWSYEHLVVAVALAAFGLRR